ncbi:diiron oxygenase [Streptomyces sp. NBC_00096]|uniref:diiron oxygenase n=1 Tax=Streptomyces sp. NBC_00096 TaxID=2975650 RepID=UPI00324B36CD
MVRGDLDTAEFFPAELVPVARHPLVRALPDAVRREVIVQHLYRYLDFTAKLEHLVVNRTALGISQGTVGLELPAEMRLDALKIYVDEGYHALMSVDLLQQISGGTGIAPRLPGEPFFLTRLAALREASPAPMRPLLEILFVIVSETLISGSLSAVPQEGAVLPEVRATIRDHALDEGRHHTYFAIMLRYLWGALDPATRGWAARQVPQLIHCFLAPDLPALRAELRRYGMPADAAEQVLAEVYDPRTVDAFVRSAAQQTVRHFASLGVLEDPRVREAFLAAGLLEP